MNIIHIDDLEELILSKHEIETELMKNKEIDKKLSLSDFITKYVNLQNNIYMFNEKVIPFNYYTINEKEYLFITDPEKIEDQLIDNLKKINYHIEHLQKMDAEKLNELMMTKKDKSLFMINGEFKTI